MHVLIAGGGIFGVTAAVVSLFSFVFASRAELQRSQLEAIALRDPLTGAGNRRGLEAELEIAMASSAASRCSGVSPKPFGGGSVPTSRSCARMNCRLSLRLPSGGGRTAVNDSSGA